MNEIVKYDNYMNELKLKGFTSTDLDFLMVLCAKMRDKDTKEVMFDFGEIKEITNYKITSKERFVNELERMNRKLMEVTCRLKTEDRILMFVLFPIFDINLKKDTLTVSVNEKFKFILNEIVKDFTRFELEKFVELDSKYTKNLYRLLKQFRTTGKLVIDDVEDFKEKLDSPKSYKAKDFKRFVLDVAVKELQDKELFKNLTYKPEIAKKRGSPIIGYTFTFEPEQIHKAIEHKEDTSKKEPKETTKTIKKPTGMTKSVEQYNSYPQRQYSKEFFDDLESKLLAVSRIE